MTVQTATVSHLQSRLAELPSLSIRRIGFADLREALARGVEDFAANRTDVLFLVIIYPVLGLVLGRAASGNGLIPLLFPLASGFALVGPLAAIGLNEMSRRREQGLTVRWSDAFGVFRHPTIGAILLLGMILVGLLVGWLVAAKLIYAATMGEVPPASITAFVHDVFSTPQGWALIGIGCAVGFCFAVASFVLSVVSFPLLLDRNVSINIAVATSLRAVAANPFTLALWGVMIAGLLVLASLPALLGLIVVMPVLGHATWHLYRRVVV